MKSEDATLEVAGAPSLNRRGTAFILAIGVNEYSNPDYSLKYAAPDARAFAEEMRRQQARLGRFARVEVSLLLDREASKANLLGFLDRLAGGGRSTPSSPLLERIGRAQPEDAVIVFFAGHGTAAGSRFYLIPHDLGYSGSQAALDTASLRAILDHSVSDRELESAFERIDAAHILLVIDACNSGQALEAEEKRRGPMNSQGLAQLAYEKGMYVLAAAQGYQAALEVGELGHGLLTYVLVEEGLKTLAADSAPKDGRVMIRELMDFATRRVPEVQLALMERLQKAGREVAIVDGEQAIKEIQKRTLQHPRVFYRREPEVEPLIVTKAGP